MRFERTYHLEEPTSEQRYAVNEGLNALVTGEASGISAEQMSVAVVSWLRAVWRMMPGDDAEEVEASRLEVARLVVDLFAATDGV